ncbi:MAG: hypothetical protein QOK00_3559 [Thermoleophilaceae bacterium]|jgi:hypothetical protein|nr:hypothetical protein [Thermoleophilaceae bacterium]
MTESPERSDQLPEEAPSEVVPDDGGHAKPHHPPGVPGEEETATGNPDAAGAEEGEEEDPAGA